MPFIIAYRYTPEHQWVNMDDQVYAEGAVASAEAKDRNARSKLWDDTTRYRVVPLPDNDPLAWRIREQAKFDSGEHKPCPWSERIGYQRYFDHIDPTDPTKVRFIATRRDGERERYTVMAPGRFYTRFINSYPEPGEVEGYCAKMGLDMTVSKLQLATTPEDIVFVYTNGPHSCMAYAADDDHYTGDGIHPCSVYAAGDLACAYITRCGDITARVMVWPDKKKFGRIYGDADRMRERLKEEGYEEDWVFAGAKLLLQRNDYGQIVAPYVDGALEGTLTDTHIELVPSDQATLILKSPDGVVEADSCHYCNRSGIVISWDEDTEEYRCDEHHS